MLTFQNLLKPPLSLNPLLPMSVLTYNDIVYVYYKLISLQDQDELRKQLYQHFVDVSVEQIHALSVIYNNNHWTH